MVLVLSAWQCRLITLCQHLACHVHATSEQHFCYLVDVFLASRFRYRYQQLFFDTCHILQEKPSTSVFDYDYYTCNFCPCSSWLAVVSRQTICEPCVSNALSILSLQVSFNMAVQYMLIWHPMIHRIGCTASQFCSSSPMYVRRLALPWHQKGMNVVRKLPYIVNMQANSLSVWVYSSRNRVGTARSHCNTDNQVTICIT